MSRPNRGWHESMPDARRGLSPIPLFRNARVYLARSCRSALPRAEHVRHACEIKRSFGSPSREPRKRRALRRRAAVCASTRKGRSPGTEAAPELSTPHLWPKQCRNASGKTADFQPTNSTPRGSFRIHAISRRISVRCSVSAQAASASAEEGRPRSGGRGGGTRRTSSLVATHPYVPPPARSAASLPPPFPWLGESGPVPISTVKLPY